MKNRIDFEVDGKKYYVIRPSQRQIVDADIVYKSAYSEAVRNGALTHQEAMRIIEQRNIWTKQDNKTAQDKLLKIHEIGMKLKEEKDRRKGLQMVLEIEQLRADLIRLNRRKNDILDNTAESYADERRLQYYVVACTFSEDGKSVFENEDGLIAKSDQPIAVEATKFTIYVIANQGEDFRNEWPDYKWRVENGLMDEQFNAVEGAFEKIFEEISKEETEEPKKTTRKRRATKSS